LIDWPALKMPGDTASAIIGEHVQGI